MRASVHYLTPAGIGPPIAEHQQAKEHFVQIQLYLHSRDLLPNELQNGRVIVRIFLEVNHMDSKELGSLQIISGKTGHHTVLTILTTILDSAEVEVTKEEQRVKVNHVAKKESEQERPKNLSFFQPHIKICPSQTCQDS